MWSKKGDGQLIDSTLRGLYSRVVLAYRGGQVQNMCSGMIPIPLKMVTIGSIQKKEHCLCRKQDSKSDKLGPVNFVHFKTRSGLGRGGD